MSKIDIEIKNLEREGSLAVGYLQHEILRLSCETHRLRMQIRDLKSRDKA